MAERRDEMQSCGIWTDYIHKVIQTVLVFTDLGVGCEAPLNVNYNVNVFAGDQQTTK
jgi:hypothetical protein